MSNEEHALHIYLIREWTMMLKPESASLTYKHYNIIGLHVEGIKLPLADQDKDMAIHMHKRLL